MTQKTVLMAAGLVLAGACGGGGGGLRDGGAEADALTDREAAGDATAEHDPSDTPADLPADVSPDGDDVVALDESPGDVAGEDPAEEWDGGPIEDRAAPGPHPKSLPFAYTRPEEGAPLSDAEIEDFTDRYLALLEHTRYFEMLDERVHGWPESDTRGRYWYGTWWSGVDIVKEGGRVTYRHVEVGADNNGLRTAQVLEGACYAFALWRDGRHERLAREVVRGFVSWITAMVSASHPSAGVLMTRAFYPESVLSTDHGRDLWIEYGLNHPGVDNPASSYVHVPDNPTWGDIWVKNKRSKDDIGHMLRAIGQVDTCADLFEDPGTAADLAELYRLYFAWARRVEDDGFRIATWDADLAVYLPPEDLARYYLVGGAECAGTLALRLAGHAHPGDISCGNGLGPADRYMERTNRDAGQILRTHHEAAVNHALLADRPEIARSLLDGFPVRIGWFIDDFLAGTAPAEYPPKNFTLLLVHAANTGLPLTWKEARWVRDRFDDAIDSYTAMPARAFDVFSSSVGNGTYPYAPSGEGAGFNDIGLLLGLCASQWRNPASKPVLDCGRVAAWSPP